MADDRKNSEGSADEKATATVAEPQDKARRGQRYSDRVYLVRLGSVFIFVAGGLVALALDQVAIGTTLITAATGLSFQRSNSDNSGDKKER